jgi:sugar phosphate permease
VTDSSPVSPARPPSGPPPIPEGWPSPPERSYGLLACVVVAYIGVYLCRKNLAVAVPMIQTSFGISKAQTGVIISYSAGAYAIGKVLFGPVIDYFGGRNCLLAVLAGVALFGGLGAFSVSFPMLVGFYTANRFVGSAGWGSIVKQTPGWFPLQRMAFPLALLSLSFVFGGVCALVLGGHIAEWSGNNWRAVMGLPSIIVIVMLAACWRLLPDDRVGTGKDGTSTGSFRFAYVGQLLKNPQLWVVCAIAFSLYIMRETFNDWSVDFFKTEGGPQMSIKAAAMLSTPFDAAGALGIVLLGWGYDHMSRRTRAIVLVASLTVLAALINYLPALLHLGLWQVETAIALIGFLSYGPYSLLAGVFAVEIGGKRGVGTVAGLVDSAGYLGTVFAGRQFGKLLDKGGYHLGFHVLALVTVTSAVLCPALTRRKTPGSP